MDKEHGRNCLLKIEFKKDIIDSELPSDFVNFIKAWFEIEEKEIFKKYYSRRTLKIERNKEGKIYQICVFLENATFDADKNWLNEENYKEISKTFYPIVSYLKELKLPFDFYLKLEIRTEEEFMKYGTTELTEESMKKAWNLLKKEGGVSYGHLFREKYQK